MNNIENACMYKVLQGSSDFSKTQHVLYFLDVWGSMISNMTYAYILLTYWAHLAHILHTSCKYTNTKCLKDQTCAIFLKSTRFKDIKYDIPCIECKIHKYTHTKCLKDPTCAIFFKSMGFKDINYGIPVCHECHDCHEGHEGHWRPLRTWRSQRAWR